MFRRMRDNEKGVAMVTVLLVGAVLTVAATTASFVAIQDLRASTDDRKASSALAYAEAGIDRIISLIRRGDMTWADFKGSGCAGYTMVERSGEIGDIGGRYDAKILRFNPTASGTNRFAPAAAACPASIPSPRHDAAQYFVVESTGRQPQAKRVVRQVIKVSALGLPIGVYGQSFELNGTPNIQTVSVISDGDIVGRGKLAFVGSDPYYKMGDFWPSLSATTGAPAAAHTLGAIYPKLNSASQEHSGTGFPLNCVANDAAGATQGQSQWDQSGAGGTISTSTPCAGQSIAPPPTSKFTRADFERVAPKPALSDQDYLTLKDAAKTTGIYCYVPTTGSKTCTKQGVALSVNANFNIGDGDLTGLGKSFVMYVEFQDPSKAMTTNEVKWGANLGPCGTESAVLIVRNGSWRMESNSVINGVLLLPEGNIDSQGSFNFIGTIIAKSVAMNGGGTFTLNQCWLDNMPGPFLDVTPTAWSEVDR
nr:pilus assembly PilX N-terminal domain-containing protein [Actinomycetota bacterium]